ncbi:hypothetical protein NXW78_28300 [Bacteroides ovatus]|nr:hypothetical protein [Bacteroides ovatus]
MIEQQLKYWTQKGPVGEYRVPFKGKIRHTLLDDRFIAVLITDFFKWVSKFYQNQKEFSIRKILEVL